MELRSKATAAKPLAVIYDGTILTESPFVFMRVAEPKKPKTLVCVYAAKPPHNRLELWKVNANGKRKKLSYSVRPDPAKPHIAIDIN